MMQEIVEGPHVDLARREAMCADDRGCGGHELALVMPVEPDKAGDTIHEDSHDIVKATARSCRQGAASSMAMHAVLALLGLCGIVIVLLSTARYGAGTFADADHYLSAARSLLAGKGYRYYYGGLYTMWPPLFPTLLAAIGLTGIDPQVGVRWLNSLAFGLIVFFSGQLFIRCTTSRALAIAGTLSVLASRPLLDWSVMAASEPVFIVLVILFGLGISRFLRRKDLSSLVWVSIIAALACLQRYAGVSLILAGAVLIGLNMSGARLLQRLKYIVIFGAISVTPVALWCIRNRMLAKETAGGHHLHQMSLAEFLDAFRAAAQGVTLWLFPWAPARSAQPIGLWLAIALAGVMIVLSRVIRTRRSRSTDDPTANRDGENARGLQIWSAAVVGAIYLGFLVVSTAGLGWHAEERHLAPGYAFLMALMIAGIEGAGWLLSVGWGHKKLVGFIGIVLCAFWLQYPFRVLHHNTANRMKDGAGGYATAAWQNSPLMEWFRNHPLPGKVYSNGSDAIYLLTGTVTWLTPQLRHERDLAELARVSASQTPYVVWFQGLDRPWLNDLREILSCCRTEKVATFPDGTVYRCLGAGGPGASAVYRFWSPKASRHFYTIDKQLRDKLRTESSTTWLYENASFYAFVKSQPGTYPVYRLRSERLNAYFYTINEAEKNQLVRDPSGTWTYEDIAFYAYPEKVIEGLSPVYRLRSQNLGCYFYTVSEREKERLLSEGSGGWTDEGIAWYAYGL